MDKKNTTHVRVKRNLDEKMMDIATKRGTTKTKIYEEMMRDYIERSSQDELISDGKFEELLNNKISNIDKHLSSMLGQLSKDLALVYCTSILIFKKH